LLCGEQSTPHNKIPYLIQARSAITCSNHDGDYYKLEKPLVSAPKLYDQYKQPVVAQDQICSGINYSLRIQEMDNSLTQNQAGHSHAVVIGGSIAGLLAAKVLLNHFDRVTLIERDHLPDQPSFRPGVPQSQHVHVLLTQGQRLLEQLFPGLLGELNLAGAPTVNWTTDWCLLGLWGWFPRCQAGLIGVACSRVLLEWLIYRRLTAYKNLTIFQACQVKGLLSSPDQSRIIGVKVSQRHAQPQSGQLPDDSLVADLVVDASGRNSALPAWLTALGYAAPKETIINAFLGYASRWYQRPEGLQVDWQGITIAAQPTQHSRGGTLFPIEGDRWIVTLGGMGQEQPSTDEQGFLEFAGSLRNRLIYDAIKEAQPLSPVYSYRRTENRWRHYEHLSRLPDGIVAVGDSVCAFNPVYGQGMTVAALGALALDQCLKTVDAHKLRSPGLTPQFQKQLAQIVANPWAMATAEDCRWATTEGPRPNCFASLLQAYSDQVVMLSTQEPAIFRTFAKVVHMVEPPTALFQPQIFVQALAHYFRWQ
jgi:2-polyprenyl-6-methoxyphenol hydroxylase-like FAD-dependent oxidoreductase